MIENNVTFPKTRDNTKLCIASSKSDEKYSSSVTQINNPIHTVKLAPEHSMVVLTTIRSLVRLLTPFTSPFSHCLLDDKLIQNSKIHYKQSRKNSQIELYNYFNRITTNININFLQQIDNQKTRDNETIKLLTSLPSTNTNKESSDLL